MNIVIVGTNFICDTFLQGLQLVDDACFYGVCSRQASTAQAFIAKYSHLDAKHTRKVFTDLADVCADPLVDIVYIASPNSCHAPQAIQCLNAGKHVLGEKPAAANARELQAIINTAKTQQRLYMEAMMSTHLPNFAILQQHLPRLGTLRKYVGQYSQYSSRYSRFLQGETLNTFLPEFANGALVDIGIYPLYLLMALWGKPQAVLASGILLSSGVDGAGDMILRYRDKQAVISYSKISNGDNITEIQGELGRIEIDFVSLLKTMTLILNDGTRETISLPLAEGFMQFELTHFIELIKQQQTESPINSFDLSLAVLQVMDDARQQIGVVYPQDRP